jgi:hypothetical protein
MDEMNTFDDATTEMFLSGAGRDVDSRLADVVCDVRAAYSSPAPLVSPELAALMSGASAAVPPVSRPVPSRRLRASLLAKVGAAVAAVVAGTGGLAVAGALPAPLQATMAHVGIGKAPNTSGSHHHGGNGHGPGLNGTSAPLPPSNGSSGTGPDGTGRNVSGTSATVHSNVPPVAQAKSHACDHEPSASHAQPCATATSSPAASDGTTQTTSTSTTTDGTTQATVPAQSIPGNPSNNGLHKGVLKHTTNDTSTDTTPTTAAPTTPTSNPHAHGGNQTTNGNATNNGNANNNGKAKGKSA